MKRSNTKTAAFAHFGAKAKNVRWGWSARSDDGATVVITVWSDEFDADDPEAVLTKYAQKDLDWWRNRPGNRDRIKNLAHAEDHCDGRFRIVVATARDPAAIPRQATGFRPHPQVMKLVRLDRQSGEFEAKRA